jgi:hypothetical protein
MVGRRKTHRSSWQRWSETGETDMIIDDVAALAVQHDDPQTGQTRGTRKFSRAAATTLDLAQTCP